MAKRLDACSASGPKGWGDDIACGVFVTISLALATLPIGLVVGFFVALAKQSSEPSLRLAGNIYTTIFRGLPELLTLFLVFTAARSPSARSSRFFSPDADGRDQQLRRRHDRARRRLLVLSPARSSCRPSAPSRAASTRAAMRIGLSRWPDDAAGRSCRS